MSRGLLRAGIGLVILGVSVPVSGLDLADDLIGLVLLAVAGRDLGSRPLLVTATLAALVDLVEFGAVEERQHAVDPRVGRTTCRTHDTRRARRQVAVVLRAPEQGEQCVVPEARVVGVGGHGDAA